MLCFDPGEEFVLLNKLLMEYIASDRLLFRLELWKLTYRYMHDLLYTVQHPFPAGWEFKPNTLKREATVQYSTCLCGNTDSRPRSL